MASEHAMSDSSLSASLAELSRFFVGDGTVQETLTRVSELGEDHPVRYWRDLGG
jgi:hypothetical protein